MSKRILHSYNGFVPEQLYHPLDPVRNRLLEGWADGDFVFVNYDGHGISTGLGSESYLTRDDVPGLTNGSYAPFFAALTCAVGNSTFPGTLGLADALVLSGSVGAIAAFAPTGLSLDVYAHQMNRAFVEALMGVGEDLSGSAAAAHEPVLFGVTIPEFMRDIYLNLGDPAVALPE